MYYNSRNYQNQNNDMSISINEKYNIKNKEQETNNIENRNKILNMNNDQLEYSKKKSKFLSESKEFLLEESLYKLLSNSLPSNSNIDNNLLNNGRNIIKNFINEEQCDSLLNKFKTQTIFLSELSSIIENTYSNIVSSISESFDINSDLTIKNSELEDFYNKLSTLDYDSLSKEISERVTKAEEKFIQDNINDKLYMEELANKTKEKIDSVKVKDSNIEESIKQEHARIYRSKINNIQNRKKGILESIVIRTSSSIISNNDTKKQYTLESGKLNTEKVIEIGELMYTFLEMVNTAKIKNVDSSYIENILSSIN